MTTTNAPPNVTLALYVRSLSPKGGPRQQDAVITRLEQLKATDHITDFTVHIWGAQVATSSVAARTDAGRFILEKVAEFEQWARDSGQSLRSFFDHRNVRSTITGEEYRVLDLPMLTLAEYHGNDLRFVAPSADGDTVYSVTDRLDTLEAGGHADNQDPSSASETPIVANE